MTQKIINLVFILFLSVSFFSCNSKNDSKENITIINKIEKTKTIIDTTILEFSEKETHKTFQYICPQGDSEGNSDKEGICPTCEMELIENPDFTK